MKKRFLPLITLLLLSILFILPVAAAASTPPAAPEVTAANLKATGKIKLTWEAVDNATSYQVWRRTETSDTFKLMLTTENTSYTNTSASVGKTYYYYIVAVAEDGTLSPASNTVSRICILPCPKVTASNVASSGKIKLTWESVEGAAEYEVYRATSKNGTYKLMLATEGTSYTNTSAKAESKYYYKVKAIHKNPDASSAYSSVVSRMCDLARPTVTAGNVASTGKIKITWDAVDGAIEYKIYRSASKNGTFKLMMTTTGCSYTNTSVEAGDTYYYKVKAIAETDDADSAFSSVKSRTCDLPRPKVTRGATSADAITISWDEIDGASHYSVYRSSTKDGTYKRLNTTESTSYTDNTVSAGQAHYYKVIANSPISGGSSAASSILTAKAVPAAVTLKTTASATASSIKISWSEADDASGYYVYRRASESDDWTRIATVTSGTSYTDESASGRLYYRVAAYATVNGTKYTGYKSSSIRCRTLGATGLTAISHVYENDISWNSVSGATSYQIYRRSENESTWKRQATLSDATSYHDENVSPSEHYSYRVRAIYKYDGVTTYGPYTASEAHYVGSCNDSYETRCYAIFGEYVDDPRLYYSSSEEAAADMVSITIKAWDFTNSSRTSKTTKNYTLKVHKNLAYTVQLMFEELYACEAKYPISDIGGFIYKNKSEHSSGLAFDINVDANPYVGPDGVIVGTEFDPENNPYSIPVDGEVEQLFYKYGFIRGIYWGNGYYDYMHFSFFGT